MAHVFRDTNAIRGHPRCRAPQRYLGGTVGTTSEVLKTRQVRGTCGSQPTSWETMWHDSCIHPPTHTHIHTHIHIHIHTVTYILWLYTYYIYIYILYMYCFTNIKIEENQGTLIRPWWFEVDLRFISCWFMLIFSPSWATQQTRRRLCKSAHFPRVERQRSHSRSHSPCRSLAWFSGADIRKKPWVEDPKLSQKKM